MRRLSAVAVVSLAGAFAGCSSDVDPALASLPGERTVANEYELACPMGMFRGKLIVE